MSPSSCAPSWGVWGDVCWRFLQLQPDCYDSLFSTWGNKMTKNRCHLTYDNLETLVYLHEVWPKAREWEARKHFKSV